jgi:hypothetical protein
MLLKKLKHVLRPLAQIASPLSARIWSDDILVLARKIYVKISEQDDTVVLAAITKNFT